MKIRSAAAASLALLAASCSAPKSGAVSLFDVCLFPTITSGVCSFTATCTASLAQPSEFDVTQSLANGVGAFVLPIQVNNQASSSANSANGTVDVNTAFVQSFEVTFVGLSIAPVTIPVQLTVPSAGSATYVVPLIPYNDFASLPVTAGALTEIVLDVTASGVFLSGDAFTTQDFQIPVVLCSDCIPSPKLICEASNQTLNGYCGGPFQTNSVSCQ